MCMKCTSLSFLITLGWKSILFNIRMASLPCFFRLFALKIFFQPFTLRQCLSFSLRWVSCKQQNVGSCLCSQSISLCLFIGKLSPSMLRNIKQQLLLLPVISVVRGRICMCGYLLLGLLKDYCFAFSRVQFSFLCWSFLPIISCRARFLGRFYVNLVLS